MCVCMHVHACVFSSGEMERERERERERETETETETERQRDRERQRQRDRERQRQRQRHRDRQTDRQTDRQRMWTDMVEEKVLLICFPLQNTLSPPPPPPPPPPRTQPLHPTLSTPIQSPVTLCTIQGIQLNHQHNTSQTNTYLPFCSMPADADATVSSGGSQPEVDADGDSQWGVATWKKDQSVGAVRGGAS